MGDDTLCLLHNIKAHEGNLHSQDGAQNVEGGVGNIQTMWITTNDHHQDNVDGDNVDDEDITTPRGHHVEVAQGTAGRDEQGTRIHRLDYEWKNWKHTFTQR